ncbi:MAG: LPS assembly protein LptD [Candidatus Protistobacter heckmanni]|nr:LPS assembly protein LptD [Candidatus Protistobacter heckmanni]
MARTSVKRSAVKLASLAACIGAALPSSAQAVAVKGDPASTPDPLAQGVEYTMDSRINPGVQTLPVPPEANLAVPNGDGSFGLKKPSGAQSLARPAPAPAPQPNDRMLPTEVTADTIRTVDEHIMILTGKVEIVRGTQKLRGDKVEYDRDTDEVSADGNVRLERNGLIATGPSAQMRIDANEGTMPDASYEFTRNRANGKAQRINFVGPGQYQAENATYSTCSQSSPDWIIRANRIDIDDDRKIGKGEYGWLYFYGMPVFAATSFSIPMDNERKTGALAPSFGYNSRAGFDAVMPYYVNIAPNRDLTLYPRILATRGLQLGAEYRYLEPTYSGVFAGDYLPGDRLAGRDHWSYSLKQRQTFGIPGLTAYVDYTRVSDDKYPDDLGRGLVAAVSRQFNQEAGLSYGSGYWSALARVQQFQALLPNTPPYVREPEISLCYNRRYDDGLNVSMDSNVTRFLSPIATVANRAYVKPEISHNYRSLAWYVTPKVSLHASAYSIDGAGSSTTPNSFTRVLPTYSLDSGVTFERDAPELSSFFSKAILQTLEPRLFYVYTPFKDQSNIPLLDSADTDFSMTQILSENPFSGQDRIADNNKVTAGVTSRFIEANTGLERARFTIAQRFDLTGQRVTITTTNNNNAASKYSDLLLAAVLKMTATLGGDSTFQYNQQNSRLQKANLSLTWRAGPQRVLNFAYRYQSPTALLNNTTLRQVQISGQWPLLPRVYGIARANYDIQGKTMVDSLVGFEYDADCWLGRVIMQRFVGPVLSGTVTENRATTQIMFQIEFKGLSKLGADTSNILRLNIPGYMPPSPNTDYNAAPAPAAAAAFTSASSAKQ